MTVDFTDFNYGQIDEMLQEYQVALIRTDRELRVACLAYKEITAAERTVLHDRRRALTADIAEIERRLAA